MNRRNFLKETAAASAVFHRYGFSILFSSANTELGGEAGIAVLLVDTDRVTTQIDQRIYGQFLEHINHSVEDGLFAEQIRGAGFEGEDFKVYWESFSDCGVVEIANIEFQNGSKSVRLNVEGGRAAIRQGRLFVDAGVKYDGSLWLKRETGSPKLTLLIETAKGERTASIPLVLTGSEWQEVQGSHKCLLT